VGAASLVDAAGRLTVGSCLDVAAGDSDAILTEAADGLAPGGVVGLDKKAYARVNLFMWLSLILSLLLLVLFPFVFGQAMIVSLGKLHLAPGIAIAIAVAVFLGGLINIPITRLEREDEVAIEPMAIFGFAGLRPQIRRVRRETIVAVNIGGCFIPAALALYELVYLAIVAPAVLWAAAAAAAIAIGVCYEIARPAPGVGIVIPGLVPAFVAVISALVFAPAHAPPVAFVAGVLGPLVGADLLHLKDVSKIGAGMVSIGGAGTFDGIILSGIVAAYLA